jgi:hypothetical protein
MRAWRFELVIPGSRCARPGMTSSERSQDLGLAISLCSLTDVMPLTIRISDHTNHQARMGMPIRTTLSRMPIVMYRNPIQKVRIWNW